MQDPTSHIPNLPGFLEPVKKHVQELLETKIKGFTEDARARREQLEPLIAQLPLSAVRDALEPFEQTLERLKQSKTLDAAIARHSELVQAANWSHDSLVDHINAISAEQATSDTPKLKPLVKVRVRDIASGVLESREDLETFLQVLRERLEREDRKSVV